MEPAASNYVNFIQIENRAETEKLREKFLVQADVRLATVIREYLPKKLIRLVFYRAEKLDAVFLVMIIGTSDNILIKLAQSYNFPRGFPLIWEPDHSIRSFGFYPKFSNDDRQMADDVTEFDNVIEINFFKKWSGFLGQMIAFEHGGQQYWTVTSKNAASHDSPFVIDAKRLFEPFITRDLVNVLVRENVHLCAEIMSRNDQVHGAKVLSETPVVTAIGNGCYVDIKNPGLSRIHAQEFVKFFNNLQLVDFCTKHKLPCDSSITISTGAALFMRELSESRDFMTDTKLNEFLRNEKYKIQMQKGTLAHCDVLGDCLEGLVIRLKYRNGSDEIKKYKFAPYTIRTMLFREEFRDFVFSHDLLNHARNFVNAWCVSPAGREYWYKIALYAFMIYPKFESLNPAIGIHIHVADHINQHGPPNDIVEKFHTSLLATVMGTVVICIGPIGSGKTTFANEFCKLHPNLMAIDGDDMGLGTGVVLKLGAERNDYTRWKIIETLMANKIPVISTGGGALFTIGRQSKFDLRSQIYHALGINVNIVTCISGEFSKICQLEKTYDPTSFYNYLDPVRNAIFYRVKNGSWKIDSAFTSNSRVTADRALENFANAIAKKSSANVQFAQEIMAASDRVYGFPAVTIENYGIEKKLDFTELLSRIIPIRRDLGAKFSQIRILVMIDDQIRHITYKYSQLTDITFSLQNFIDLYNAFGTKQVPGKIVTLADSIIAVPDVSIHDDGSTHVTIDAGDNLPRDMRKIALAIRYSHERISLTNKKSITHEYKLTDAIVKPCTIHVLAAFAVVF